MTPAPSSPVPAVERIELPGGFYWQRNGKTFFDLRKPDGGFLFDTSDETDARAFAAAMSTPTPGRAAEPDTMGEVERLAAAYGRASFQNALEQPSKTESVLVAVGKLRALLSAVRTIDTERDDARTRAEGAEAQLSNAQERISDLEYALKNIAQHHPKTPGLSWDYDLQLAESAADIAKRALISTSGADR